jgi:hypothetical protein
MATDERDAEPTFTVDISIENNTLVVGENGGNVVGAPENIVVWRTGPDEPMFTLEFFQLIAEPTTAARKDKSCGHTDVAAQPHWPFSYPPNPPPGGVTEPARKFVGVLKGPGEPATSFKYYVTVDNLRLDPIIIVDR